MKSLRQPKRITIRGDDEKEYKFLVKGGEDLRLDQRLEQVAILILYCSTFWSVKKQYTPESYEV